MFNKIRGAQSHKKVLFKNTVMLYILRFSTYFFGFVTVPYQTRILGPEIYGKVGAAMALMVYFQLLIDFGFMLSGTQEVAFHSDDQEKVSEIYSSIQISKIALSLASFLLLSLLCYLVPLYRGDYTFYLLYLVGTVIVGLVPDFVFRGMQAMGAVTLRVVISRLVFTAFVFVFLKGPEDYMVVPLLSALGNFIAFFWALLYLRRSLGIKFVKVSKEMVLSHTKVSSSFFLSRIASTLYSSSNVLILGHLAPLSRGDYAVSDKLLTTGQSALTPISDSIYPYMTKNKDFKLIKKILMITMPVIILSCAIAFVFAKELSVFIFGKDYAGAGEILRGLMPAAVFTLPDYLMGFPTMTALGITKQANYSIYVSSALHVVNLMILYLLGHLNAVTLAWSTSLATGVDLLYRSYQVRKQWRKMKQAREL